jgi:uroporphyrinogen decarboxylase
VGDPIQRIKAAFEGKVPNELPKGELWIGREVFRRAKLEDDVASHLTLRRELGMDFVFLPLSEESRHHPTQGYRYFNSEEVKEASIISDLFVGVVVDGPFQRMVEKKGLIRILTSWKKEEGEFAKEYRRESHAVEDLIMRTLDRPIGAVVLAEDVATEKSTWVKPEEVRETFFPFYSKVVAQIHNAGAYALYHSCGNIGELVRDLIHCGFEGLAAVQGGSMNLISLREVYGSRLVLMAGIDGDLLQRDQLPQPQMDRFSRLIRSLSRGGGYILCSSCGLYSGDFLERLLELYQTAQDAFLHSSK